MSPASPAAAAFQHSPPALPELPWRMPCLNVRALSPCLSPCPGMLGWAGLPFYNNPAQLELPGVLLNTRWVMPPWFPCPEGVRTVTVLSLE